MLFSILLGITLLCLFFKPMKACALIGIGLLLALYPFITIPLLVIAGGIYWYFHRSKRHATPQLPH